MLTGHRSCAACSHPAGTLLDRRRVPQGTRSGQPSRMNLTVINGPSKTRRLPVVLWTKLVVEHLFETLHDSSLPDLTRRIFHTDDLTRGL